MIDSCVPTHSSTESAPIPSVISRMRSTPSCPRSTTMSVATDILDDAAVFVAHDRGLGYRLQPRHGHRSEPHTHAAATPMTASVGLDCRAIALFEADVTRRIQHRSQHVASPSLLIARTGLVLLVAHR